MTGRLKIFGYASGMVLLAVLMRGEATTTAAQPSLELDDSTDDSPVADTARIDPAVAKYWTALKYFRSTAPADLAKGRVELEQSAAGEYSHAQLLLGESYQFGSYGYRVDAKKAAAYYRLSAERGNAFAKVNYGLCVFSGVGVRMDFQKAAEWFNAALASDADYSRPDFPADFFENNTGAGADEGVAGTAMVDPVASARARAHYFLGVILESQKKSVEAQGHYVAAANGSGVGREGISQAAVQAAVNYAFGRGVARDPAKAKEMLTIARTLGRKSGISMLHSYATAKLVDDFAVSELEEAVAKANDEHTGDLQLNIARMMTDKKSKDYNPREAVQWFELAAESGKAWAMLELGLIYARGDLGKPEPEKAFKMFEQAGSGEKPKHFLGVANLVICHRNGIGTPVDAAKARDIAKPFRDWEFVCDLALRDQGPKTVLSLGEAVELNRRWATERKDMQAIYLMGLRSELGFGVKRDLGQAASWYKQAAKAKHGPASRQLGFLYETNPAIFKMSSAEAFVKAADLYRTGAAARDAPAAAYLANMMANGRGVSRDEEGAKRAYEQALAIDPKLTLALNNLSMIYESRFRTALNARQDILAGLNRTMMLDLLEKADAAGYDYAAFNLGRLQYDGVLGKPDFQKAYTYFELAAERGNLEARYRLGQMLENGEGVPVSYVEAAYHYRVAALENHVPSLRRLIAFYMEGKGGSQNFTRAQFWLQRLINLGEMDAMGTMADLALRQQQYTEAVKLLQVMEKSTNRALRGIACERLSLCYRDGLSVKKSPRRSKSYFDQAVELKNPEAMCRVAQLLIASGRVQEGMKWFHAAAAESALANYSLGQLYFFGQGVPADRDRAIVYLRRAARDKSPEALYFLAAMNYRQESGAPPLAEAIEFALAAEAMAHPNASTLRSKLEQRRQELAEKSTVADVPRF